MSIDGSGLNGTSAEMQIGEATGVPDLFCDAARDQLVRDLLHGSEAVLASAAEAMARVQHEIDYLWHDSISAENRALAERLSDVSRALQRAGRLLDQDPSIG